jgi:hypothetical protein
VDTITLPATLSGTLNLADINHLLRTDEVKLDWSKVQTFRPDQLSELLTDLDLVELPPEHDDGPMAGILLYTAAPDSEGTLGGLVGLGTPELFGSHIDHALEQMQSCTSDPLCAEHTCLQDQSLHEAACHACLFLPETSCERGNKYLDRSILVSTVDRAELTFFMQNL